MQDAVVLRVLELKYRSLSVLIDERMRRQWAAAESRAYGWGGVRALSSVIGMSPNTIRKGLVELAVREENPDAPVESGLRRKGAGRKKSTDTDPELLHALESLVEPMTRDDHESALRWTCKSTTLLAQELTRERHPVSPRTVGRLLNASGYRKVALQELVNKLAMPIHVRHFPPATSEWNKIEHQLFSHITRNWRGRPLVSHQGMIALIANTTTQAGLKIRAELDTADTPQVSA